jgi:hypothetical protein
MEGAFLQSGVSDVAQFLILQLFQRLKREIISAMR